MGDFQQTGLITTLHRLGPSSLERIEAQIKQYARERPMSLVLPCLYTEIHGPGLPRILEVLREVSYLTRIIVSVSGSESPEDFQAVREFFRPIPEAICVWGSGPTVGELLASVRDTGLNTGPDGKGRAVWLGAGYAIARGDCDGLIFHDCDITTYDRSGDALESFQIDQVGGSVLLLREIGRHAAVFVGVERVSGDVDIETGDPTFRGLEFDDGGLSAGFQWDRMDDLYFPNSGVFVDARYSWSDESLGADLEYEQVNIDAGIAKSFGRHTVVGLARYATTLDNNAPVYGLIRAGGFARLTGFSDDELVGQHFAMGLLSYRFEIGRTGFLPAYVGTTVEYGNVADFRNKLFDDALFSGSLYFGYRSPVGPFYLGYGFAEGGRERFFVRIGNIFGRGNIAR